MYIYIHSRFPPQSHAPLVLASRTALDPMAAAVLIVRSVTIV